MKPTCQKYAGLDHLLYSGRGAGGSSHEGEATELHVACFMGLVSFLAGRLEVIRVATWHSQELFNGAARATIQSATVTSTPLTDAGLDGTDQVIQVRSCVVCWAVYIRFIFLNGSADIEVLCTTEGAFGIMYRTSHPFHERDRCGVFSSHHLIKPAD